MIAFILGLIIGYLTAIPVGPINLAVIMKGLSNKTGQGVMIGAGSAFMDIIYCSAAMFGISMLVSDSQLQFIFQVATFVIFFFFGIKTTFFKIHEAKLQRNEDAPGFKRYFLLGMALYLPNIPIIGYWITVAGIVHSYRLIDPSPLNNLLFSLGTGLGTVMWFFTLVELVERHKMKFDVSTLQKITRLFGIILIIISSVMGWNLVKELMVR